MASALDVAKYFLYRLQSEQGEQPTQMKLYKLVYYAQAWSLVFLGRRLFEGEIQAWSHGPVPVDLRPTFQGFKDNPIVVSSAFYLDLCLKQDEVRIVDLVFDAYRACPASYLRQLTHAEEPWLKARKGLPEDAWCDEPILDIDMYLYYSSFEDSDAGNWSISPDVTKLDKVSEKVGSCTDSLENSSRLEETESDLSDFELAIGQLDSTDCLSSVSPELAERIRFAAKYADKPSCYENKEYREKLSRNLASYID